MVRMISKAFLPFFHCSRSPVFAHILTFASGVGIGGQQVVGIVDALHEAVGAGYPDDPSTQVPPPHA